MACRGGDRNGREYTLAMRCRPLQNLHAAHRSANDAKQIRYLQPVKQNILRAYHVAYGDDRKVEAIGRAVGALAGRAGGTCTAANDILADDEISVRVDGFAGADHIVPPAGAPGERVGPLGWWSPVSAWQINMAFDLSPFSVP
ncbi:MAG: hypothetical protein CM15mP55_2920 [Hyphomicrobiales bacterium]|nr:MAG: hypothetical protein CM15mP55_2920 [Hyphomicrobiales bacterium]